MKIWLCHGVDDTWEGGRCGLRLGKGESVSTFGKDVNWNVEARGLKAGNVVLMAWRGLFDDADVVFPSGDE